MRLSVLLTLCWLVGLSPFLRAQQIIDVLPLTDRILMIHLDEGYVNHHQRGQKRGDESVTLTPLNVALATTPATYGLSSSNDANYSPAKQPTTIGRKSKGTDFAFLCQNYGSTGCVNTDADHAKEHWLYLSLPTPLQRGKSYTLNTGAVGSNGSTWPFVFDEKTIRSEAVHVNQIGYKPNAALKFGYVYHWLGDKGGLDLINYAGKDFWVVNTATNQVAFTGKLTLAKLKTNAETGQTTDTPNANFAGADVYECNFSGLTTPGSYVLAVEGIGRSFPFVINQNVYAEVFGSVMNGLFKNRSGIALTVGELSDQNRPAPHNPDLTPGFKLYYSTARDYDYQTDGGSDAEKATTKAAFEAGKKGLINTWGWYQDAGDWDGYFTHTRVPVNLLFLYESFPTKFTDNALKLTERGNGQPDVLDEARWLLRYFYRTRHAIMDNGWGTGGVGGARVTGDYWGGDERADGTTKASWDDTDRDWYLSGEDVWMTYRYAGMAAHYAFCLQKAGVTDVESINWQQEAIDAYTWAKSKQTAADETVKGDYNLKNDRLYAAAALYRLTGDASYHDQFKADFGTLTLSAVDFGGDGRFGLWVYANLPVNRTPDAAIVSAIRNRAQNAADENLLTSAKRRAARWGGNFFFPMLVGQGTSPMIHEGITGYNLLQNGNSAKANEYLSYLATTADYFLGNNPLNQTWVTGLGERYPREIFHMDSWYSGSNTTRTGIVPYGPWRTSNPRPAQIGWWDLHWPEKTLYPANMDTWPGHERWFDQRPTPLSAEFTIHQSQLWSIMAYGTLFAADEPPFQNIAVTGVSVAPQSLTVSLGGTAKATATVQPGNATNPGVNWTSNNSAVATVAADGTITGVSEGTATVTVTTVDGSFSQSVAILVQRIAVTNLTTSPQSLTVKVGRTAVITATVEPANASNSTVTWTSSNPAIASVTSGTVTGIAEGSAVITARTADGGIERQTSVTVGAILVFTCPGNLAVNGDLEGASLGTGASAANSGFQAFPPTQTQLVSDAVSGVQAVQIGITTDGYMHQIIFNVPVKRYTLRVKAKRMGNPGYAGFKLQFQDAAGTELSASTGADVTSSDYQEVVIGPITAPATVNKILIQFYAGSGGSLYVDDVCLTAQDIADTEAPAAPTGLKADNVLSQRVQLSWTPATDNVAVTRYDVYQGTAKLGETTSPTFSVTGLSANTSYTFTVKAVDTAGNVSAPSTGLSVTTPASDPRYVLTPTDDKDNDGNGTNPTVNHSQFTNAYYKFNLSGVSGTPVRAILRLNKTATNPYLIYLGVHPDSQDGWTETGTTNPDNATVISTRSLPAGTGSVIEFDVTEYVKAELSRNRIASFQLNTNVSGWLSLGTKENTGAKPELIITSSAFADSQPPTAPGSLTATEVAAGGFRLSWTIATDNVGVTGYEVYNGAAKLATLSSDVYTYLIKGLTPATAYNISVKALDGAGNGTSSAPITVSTAPVTATALTMVPTDDSGNPDNTLGTSPALTLSQYNTAFLRFDLSNVQAPLANAKLRLYSGSGLSIVLKAASPKNWSETNQSTLPSATGAELKTADASANAYVELDVTDLVQAALAGDKLLSWALNHRAGDWRSLRSKEASDNRPQLVLTLNPETVPTAPTFSGIPQSGTACPGQALTLTASCASGTVSWQGSSQGIINGGSIVLPTMTGTFSYSAVCQGATLTSPAAATSLTIRPAIAIATQPLAATSLCTGANIRISVTATGENLAYHWQKDGLNLNGATAATLSLTDVQSAQAGTYRVVVTGTCGSVTSEEFVLTVNAPVAPNYASVSGQTYPAGQTSVTVIQNSGNVTFAATTCTGQLNWSGNGTSGTGNIVAIAAAPGTFVYTGTCTLGGCISAPASVTVTVLSPVLNVHYADGDGGQTANNQAKPNLRLVNDGTTAVPLSELTVRYWFTAENFANINTWIDYAQVGSGNVRMKYERTEQPRNGADGYIEYSFTSGAGSLAPNGNSGPIQSRFANKDFGNLDESDDYSFRAGANYANTDRITLYRTQNGGAPQLIWGTEPAVVPASHRVKILMENKNAATNTNSISTFLKLDNLGNVPINYEDLVVRYWFTSEGNAPLQYTIDYTKLGNGNVTGKFVRLNPARTKADAYFELAFKPTLGSLYPRSSTGNIQYRLNKSDWSNFNETNDYSFLAAAPFAENNRVTVYLKGELLYGTEPATVSAGRLAADEAPTTWRVAVAENPTQNGEVRLQITGAAGQNLRLQLTDIQGRLVTEQQIDEAQSVEQRSLPTGGRTGILLLRVSTPQKAVSMRILTP